MGKVLVVDDESDLSLMVRMALRMAGHESLEATSGEEALEVLAGQAIDAMLLDLHLPRMDGWEVLQRVRADPACRELKIIVMSAHSSPGTKERAAHLGSDAYLTKPFALEELTNIVASALA